VSTGPADPAPPDRPVTEMTTADLNRHRRHLERALRDLPIGAPAREQSQQRLAEILAEQDSRTANPATARPGQGPAHGDPAAGQGKPFLLSERAVVRAAGTDHRPRADADADAATPRSGGPR
jgi:hypothetical protein